MLTPLNIIYKCRPLYTFLFRAINVNWLIYWIIDKVPCNEITFLVWRVCGWVRKIARVTRADRRRMVELREETGVQRSLTERLVRSRLQWAGHVERMTDDRLPKGAAELREQGRRRRGRPRLRWEDCVKRDVKKAGEEGDWKKKTHDRVGWKRLADEAVKKLQASPHPWQREKEEERERTYHLP